MKLPVSNWKCLVTSFTFVLCTTLLAEIIYLFALSHVQISKPPLTDNWSTDNLASFILTARLAKKPHVKQTSHGTRLVIVVSSAVEHVDIRREIRRTWGEWVSTMDQELFFIVGNPEFSKESRYLNAILSQEQKSFNDLIEYDFVDSYKNLTIKTLFILRFFSEEILSLKTRPQVWKSFPVPFLNTQKSSSFGSKFVLKVDDDVFLHVSNLMRLIDRLSKLTKFQTRPLDKLASIVMAGNLIRSAKPVRSSSSKYYMSMDRYQDLTYPDYLSGTAYLMSAGAARSLYITAVFAKKCSFFPMEDIFLSGFCASKAVAVLNDFFYLEGVKSKPTVFHNSGFGILQIGATPDICSYLSPYLITLHGLIPSQMRYVFKKLASPKKTYQYCKQKQDLNLSVHHDYTLML